MVIRIGTLTANIHIFQLRVGFVHNLVFSGEYHMSSYIAEMLADILCSAAHVTCRSGFHRACLCSSMSANQSCGKCCLNWFDQFG